jgi:hypothetical protein
MPMPARTVLPAKFAAAEKHMAGWKVHEILREGEVFFCFRRVVRCRGGCLFWRGAAKKGAQAGVPVPLKGECSSAIIPL